jgi:cytochrome P450
MQQDYFDLMSAEPDFAQDPYPTYARLRQSAPICRVVHHGLPGWLVTRYEDVQRLLTDPRVSNDPRHGSAAVRAAAPWAFAGEALGLSRHILQSDPPDHTRLRRLVGKVFTPRRVAALQPRIEQVTRELLDGFLHRGEAELIDEFAVPLPIIVIMDLLGVPREARHDFREWCRLSAAEPDDPALVFEAFGNIRGYLGRLVGEKRRQAAAGQATADLASALVAVHDEGQRLDDDELVSMIFLLLIAGFETTVDLIGNGTLALLHSPGQLAALRADPSLIDGAIEEFIRFDGPVEMGIWRFATDDIDIGGVTIPRGDVVLIGINAANRDPGHFAAADVLDIRRDASRHLGFGHGIHYCLGAPLARLEGRIAFTALLIGCQDLALAVEPADLEWRRGPNVRGVKHLPVTFTPAGGDAPGT